MAESTRGMGRGLAAILASAGPIRSTEAGELREVPVSSIVPNPRQPRRTFDEQALLALASSLDVRGVLQPVLVRPTGPDRYELIAGERRWRASQIAGRETIPAIIRPHDDTESLELALIENMAREDLNPVDQARACQALIDELAWTREEVGRRVGRSRVAVSNLVRLLDLPDEALQFLENGDLTEGHGRALLLAPDHGARRRLAREAVVHGWSVRRVEAEARAVGAPKPPAPEPAARRVSDDHRDAADRLAEAFTRTLGTDVRVAPKGDGFAVTLQLPSWEDALAVAERIGAMEAA